MTRYILLFILVLFAAKGFAQEKINGVSLVSIKQQMNATDFLPIKELGANWISLVPFCDFDSLHKNQLIYNQSWEYYGERLEGLQKTIQQLHNQGFKIMLKPQIREQNGRYVGHIDFLKKKNWRLFEQSYKAYIFAVLQIAIEENVELFCIGTELGKFVKSRPKFWKKLIKEIRESYKGKLTYAANWDDYETVPFWKKLDYIGIDAYFPISKKKNPTPKDLLEGWESILEKINAIGNAYQKRILFTEYGYRSIEKSASKPWLHSTDATFDATSQANSLQALYKAIWNQPYFAGGFLWRWYPYHPNAGGKGDTKYTVQNKVAENVVRKVYTKQ